MVAQHSAWVLLSYRVPREPSTPRIAIWRRLKQLGVLQIGDGLVALPRSPETLEQLEWVADRVLQADGDAIVWTADASTRSDSEELTERLRNERSAEYASLADDIRGARGADQRTVKKWRSELARIERRDHLASPGRDAVVRLLSEHNRDHAGTRA